MVSADCGAGEAGIDGHEEIELFGGRELLFGCRHVPAAPSGGGVVICPPIFGDAAMKQQERRLGRRLASAGIVAQRFDHRGTGRSEGDVGELYLDSLVADARKALDLLYSRCAIGRGGIAGMGIGAWVAARLAREHDAAPLVLWQPFTHPWRERELLATSLGQDLFHSGASLVDEVGVRKRPILVVGSALGSTVERWRARGFAVDTVDATKTVNDPVGESLANTAAWLAAH